MAALRAATGKLLLGSKWAGRWEEVETMPTKRPMNRGVIGKELGALAGGAREKTGASGALAQGMLSVTQLLATAAGRGG